MQTSTPITTTTISASRLGKARPTLTHRFLRACRLQIQIGHDYPQKATDNVMVGGMQMKILAAAPGSPLMRCMLDRIIDNVRRRWTPGPKDNPLSLTGPALLYQCYRECTMSGECTHEGEENLLRRFDGPREEWDLSGQSKHVVSKTHASNTSVAVTYRDARQAAFPHSGMMGTDANGSEALLAYEAPKPIDFGYSSSSHYSNLIYEGRYYRDDCSIGGW